MATPLESSTLFEHLDKIKESLDADDGDNALKCVKIIKEEGERWKKVIEGFKTRSEKKLKSGVAELKQLEDKYVKLGKGKEEASQQLDDIEIERKTAGLACRVFSRDECENDLNLKDARKNLEKAVEHLRSKTGGKWQHEKEKKEASRRLDAYKMDEVDSVDAVYAVAHSSRVEQDQVRQKLEKEVELLLNTSDELLLNTSEGSISKSTAREEVKNARDKLEKARNLKQATKLAKDEETKKLNDAKKRYHDVKKEYRKTKEIMQTSRDKLAELRKTASSATGACTELQIILDLNEYACSSAERLKQALERRFLNNAIEETTNLPNPIPSRIISHHRSSTQRQFQGVEKAMQANRYLFK